MKERSEISAATRIAAVIGHPVEHSLSPALHNAAFAASSIDAVYLGLPVPAGRAATAVEAMRCFGWLGLSVTMPHKADVLAALDDVTDRAASLGAANCVFWSDGRLVGDNTDGAGWLRGLDAELGVTPEGRRVGVVGAGGAARAVVLAAAGANAREVVVINRSEERAATAAALAGRLGRTGTHDDLAALDLVVNATPQGMADTDASAQIPFDVARLDAGCVVCDLIYHPAETPLLAAAAARGLTRQNGLAMLIHQAAVAFERWTGTTAPVKHMTAAISGPLTSPS